MASKRLKRTPIRISAEIDWEAWSRFLAAVDDAAEKIGFEVGEERFYRGHGDATWKLEPTLIREFGGGNLDTAEDALFWEFQARARELHQMTLTDWDVLFYMRHHGVPTRLLDWTETLGIALYFALEKLDEKSTAPCIWVLNPYKLNRRFGRDELIAPRYLYKDWDYGDLVSSPGDWPWTAPLAIYPQQKPSRMGAQRGWFTIHGESLLPIERQAANCVARVPIPLKAVAAARAIFEIAGIDPYGIYADLDGLGQSVVAKNRVFKNPARRR